MNTTKQPEQMSTTRKIEGLARTWEEPIGIRKAAFCEGTSKVREGLGYVPATLIIGGKGYTEEEVKAMLNDYDTAKADPGAFVRRRRGEPMSYWIAAAVDFVLNKHGIKL